MAARKPKLELYWTKAAEPEVNWHLKAANGEVLCQSTQGSRDKTDAMRNVFDVARILGNGAALNPDLRVVGPGKKLKGVQA